MTKDQQITQLRQALTQTVRLVEDYRRLLATIGHNVFHQPPELTAAQTALRDTAPKK